MNTSRCCIFVALLLAALFGVASGLLFAFALIPSIVIGVWIAFGLAVLVLLILLALTIAAAKSNNPVLRRCLYTHGTALLIAALATLVLAVMALSTVLIVITSFAVLIGLLGAAAAAMLFILGCLLHRIFIGLYSPIC